MSRPRRALAGAAVLGLTVLWIKRVVLPARPDDAALPIPRRTPAAGSRPSPDGAGVRIVVNPASGPAWSGSPAETLRSGLPAADVHVLRPGDDLVELLCHEDLVAIGAAGGDGTLATAAVIAADRQLPLIAIPAGTLNHLARDLGLDEVDDAVAAVRAGTFTHMDLGVVGDRCFVNTLSFGGYSQVVDTRERYEKRLGKWPALLLALVTELPAMEPLHVEVDGQAMRLWLAWIGNCQYAPDGFAPSWRERLDDGLLDVRLVHGTGRFSRARLVLDVLAGRLQGSSVYEERVAQSVHIRSLDGPLRLATDGETYDGPADLLVTKRARALLVAVPPR